MTKRARVRAARAMVTMMRVVGDKEGGGSKVMAMAKRLAGERTATVMKRAMATKMRLGGTGGSNGHPLCTTQQP